MKASPKSPPSTPRWWSKPPADRCRWILHQTHKPPDKNPHSDPPSTQSAKNSPARHHPKATDPPYHRSRQSPSASANKTAQECCHPAPPPPFEMGSPGRQGGGRKKSLGPPPF